MVGSEELKTLLAEREGRHKAELAGLQRNTALVSHQTEMQKLRAEHAEARFQAELKLRKQRHQMRIEKQRLLHEHNKEMVLLRKNYPLELKRQREAKKAEEERQAREKRTREQILEAIYQALLASMETDRKLFLGAFGVQDDDKAQDQ
jgi:hypothetical protein